MACLLPGTRLVPSRLAGFRARRVASSTWFASTGESVSFRWGLDDAILSMTDDTGTTQYGRDDEGNLTLIRYPSGAWVEFQRDVTGLLGAVAVMAPVGATPYITNYRHDEAGNLTRIEDPMGGTTTMTYDAVNRVTSRTLPNGVTTEYGYDLRDRLTSIVHRRPNQTVLASETYDLNPNGEPWRITREDGRRVEYQYDDALRLVSEVHYDAEDTVTDSITYTWDDANNRLSRTVNGLVEVYTYDPGHQLVSVTSTQASEGFVFDVDGRVGGIARDGTTWSLEYDFADGLTHIEDLGTSAVASYVYDGAGRRVQAIDPGGAERNFLVAPFLGDGLESIQAVFDDQGELVSGYVYAGEHPVMRYDPSGVVYYLEDRMGSVRWLADETGAEVARLDYDAFGNVLAGAGAAVDAPSGVGGDFRYHGAWLEEATGLYYMRARHYDPRTGRFLSRDAAEPNDMVPETYHPYGFVNGNPVLYRDPTGMFTLMGLNMSVSIQDGLRATQQAATQYVRQHVINEAKGVAADFLTHAIEGVFTAYSGGGFAAVSSLVGADSDDLFGRTIIQSVCRALPLPKVRQGMYVNTQLDRSSGKPSEAHFSLGDDCDFPPKLRGKRQEPGPDLLISPDHPPDQLDRSSRKSWLQLEVKRSLRTMERKWRKGGPQEGQIRAIAAHARNYQYGPVVMVVAWEQGNVHDHRILKVFADHGVVPLILRISD